jgi:hypothetical protein
MIPLIGAEGKLLEIGSIGPFAQYLARKRISLRGAPAVDMLRGPRPSIALAFV